MSDYVRQASFNSEDFIEAPDFENEFNAILVALNSKADPNGNPTDNLVAEYLFEETDRTSHALSKVGGTGKIPLCNGTLQVELNADKLDGLDAAAIAGTAFPLGMRMLIHNTELWFTDNLADAGWQKVPINTLANWDPVIMVGDGWDDGSDGTQAQPGYSLGGPGTPYSPGVNTDYRWGLNRVGGSSVDNVVLGRTITANAPLKNHTHQYSVDDLDTVQVQSGTGTTVVQDVGALALNTTTVGDSADGAHAHNGLEAYINNQWRPPHIYMLMIERV